MKQSVFAALATVAMLCAALPVTAQTPPASPAPSALPTPSLPPAVPSPAASAAPVSAPVVTPPPLPAPSITPSAPGGPATPAPSASPGGKGKHSKNAAAPTPSPPEETPSPPAFASLDGDWEFVESSTAEDVYSRLVLRQTGQQLIGTWKQKNKSYPVTGEYENAGGKSGIRLTATIDGKEWTMSGYVDNASDMVGIVRDPAGKAVVFTANHRAAAKQELLIKP